LAAREVELIPIEVPETPQAPAAVQGQELMWHEQQQQQEMMRVQQMQQQQQMVMHPGQQGRMQQPQQQQQPHSMMQQQQQHGMYDQQAMYGAPAGMSAGMGPGGMMPVAGVGVEGGFLAPGMVPVGFDGGLQQQQRKRSGNSNDLEGLKPTKSVKVRPASYKLLMIQLFVTYMLLLNNSCSNSSDRVAHTHQVSQGETCMCYILGWSL
jgi:hypothetical protein